MKEMTVTLFNPQGNFYQNGIINEQNFDEQVAYYGALLSGGCTVKIDDITYTPIRLPEFLADMNKLKDISTLHDYFVPYLTYILHVKYIQVSEFLEINKEFQNKIKEAMNKALLREIDE